MNNPYTTLGVDENAPEKDIKKAYRKKAAETHPDKGGDAEKFQEVNQAYLILADPKKRKEFDETGNVTEDQTEQFIISEVSKVFFFVIDQPNFDPNKHDIIQSMLAFVDGYIAEVESKNEDLENYIEKKEQILGRVTNKEGEENIFDGLLNGVINDCKYKISTNNDKIERFQTVKALIETYECKQEITGDLNWGGPRDYEFSFDVGDIPEDWR